ncbi:MAG: NAD-glutamate dehydrogenase [Alphaproteobacteria bacterium]|nr:NAD-glutamate dehydrogenase [Alphaproteobacteria bacterium]
MPQQAERLKDERIEQATALAGRRLSAAQAAIAAGFVRQFAQNIAPEDVAAFAAEDLYGAAMSLFAFAQERAPGTAKIRVYSPRADADGWSCRHTVVEIVNDDMPFLVDSVGAELARHGLAVHLFVHPIVAVRRAGANLVEVGAGARESLMHIEIAAIADAPTRAAVHAGIAEVLTDVRRAVGDWQAMRARMDEARRLLAAEGGSLPADERAEADAFLAWLADDHFTFLGSRDYAFGAADGQEPEVAIVAGSGLGILTTETTTVLDGLRRFASLPLEVRQFLRQPTALVVSKASHKARVHRPNPMDVIAIKRFDRDGTPVGLRLFAGLYTSAAYSGAARAIPILRRKVARVTERSGFDPASHDGKALLHILDSYPRDELFQIDEDALFDTARGILHLEERPRVALFIRRDPFERFVSCLVFVPRDRYDTELRHRFQEILGQAFAGEVVTFHTHLAESPLARVLFVVRTTPGAIPAYAASEVERLLVEAARSWSDRLKEALDARMGEPEAIAALRRFADAFPASYRERFTAAVAVLDLDRIAEARTRGLALAIYRPVEAAAHEIRLKVYHPGAPMPLSDVLPVLENLGFRVINEIPDTIRPADAEPAVWIHDFGLAAPDGGALDIEILRPLVEEAFHAVWTGRASNDGLNRLVRAARLSWPEARIVRIYARYLRQVGFPISQTLIEDTLCAHPHITRLLVRLFAARFDPAPAADRLTRAAGVVVEIEHALDGVQGLEEDRTLRAFLALMRATLRTNHYRRDAGGVPRPYLSIKLDSHAIDFLPLPKPMVEVFVHSPRTEAIHLRGGKVARGGIRWSDRREDFRTEILGLMKAQMVKNAVIVPVGSKGGFVVKQPPASGGREALQAEVIHCYRTLMQGLLDITDNLVEDKVVPPPDVVRHDGDDPYLVVAADKGTATFSDIANGIAADYGFWLGDAFASGGSKGYDHKAMAITARGAWEAVKRHFGERGVDVQTTDFTVAGVGDMSGDVFGNGMLQAPHIRLVAAFDHRHIMIDPDPDAAAGFAERRRLFALPRSSWADYERTLLSTGGGVFERGAKSIPVSPQMAARFGIVRERVTPAELMQAILRADVDLLWFGGIGTFVKASDETHADAGDKANDAVRIDGADIRARVVGEGANLGVTQRGRIEYARHGAGGNGGAINTDAIDNSAGVDTSDHEVNIKILLDAVVAAGDMTGKQRDRMLVEMADEVAALVLRHNYLQTLALTIEQSEAPALLAAHARAMVAFEHRARLDRTVEFLPDDAAIARRAQEHAGLVRPELAVLLAYAKMALFNAIVPSPLPDDPALDDDLLGYFPSAIREHLGDACRRHRLRREIVATVVTNALVNRAGIAYVATVEDATAADWPAIAQAWLAARDIFALDAFWVAVEALDGKVPATLQTELFLAARRLVEMATPYLLDAVARGDGIGPIVAHYIAGTAELENHLADLLPAPAAETLAARVAALAASGVPEALAQRAASFGRLAAALTIVDQALASATSFDRVARLHFAIDARFRLGRLDAAADVIADGDAWSRRAAAAAQADLARAQRALLAGVLAVPDAPPDAGAALALWIAGRPRAVERIDGLLTELDAQPRIDLAMLTVATRTLRAAVEGTA